jgi:hypothetical protein
VPRWLSMKNCKAQGKHGKLYVFKWIIISLRTHFYKKSNSYSNIISHGIMILFLTWPSFHFEEIIKQILSLFTVCIIFLNGKVFWYQMFNVFGRHGFMFLNAQSFHSEEIFEWILSHYFWGSLLSDCINFN